MYMALMFRLWSYDVLTIDVLAAVTIATRYLHVRRQFSENSKGPETPVIHYPSVYMRIVPALVNAFVFKMLGKQMVTEYNAMALKLKDGDTALLAE